MTIIPRHTTGVSALEPGVPSAAGGAGGRRKPIDMQGRPCDLSGTRRFSVARK